MWQSHGTSRVGPAPGWKVVAGLVLVLAGAGCDSLLDVTVPGRIAADRLNDPTFADIMSRSVQGAFECALTEYSGGSALFGAEMWTASNNSSRDHYGNRIFDSVSTWGQSSGCSSESRANFSVGGSPYIALALGRDVTRRFEAWTDADVPNRNRHMAYTATYTAYTMTILGEGYCRAVLEPSGPALQPKAVLAEAEAWFTKGLGYADAANEATARNLALLGRARVRLDLGNLDGAVADAQRIPENFSVDATRGTAERQNRMYAETWRTRDMTINPRFYDLTVAADGRTTQRNGVADPRVVVRNMGFKGVDGVTASWFPVNKHAREDSPTRMASWAEAQLIIAEARLGQVAVDRINALRTKHGLPLYSPANVNDREAILDQVIEERRRELWMEGRWLNDMIRHKGRKGVVWNEGMNHQNITEYRALYCLPLPQREVDSNPNVTN